MHMLDTLKKSTIDRDLLSRYIEFEPSQRIERMREAYMALRPSASLDRARIEARVMKETAGEPMIIRRAKVFAAAVREMPIDIYPDELIVGCVGTKPRSENITPTAHRLASGMPKGIGRASTVSAKGSGTRMADAAAAYLSDEERRELKEELTPVWNELGRPEHMWHYGHNIHSYEKVLKSGFLGIRKQAEDRLARIDPADPEESAKRPFLEGVIIAMEAAAEIGLRYAALARELAEKEPNADRKRELQKIAEICDRVPAHPAETFHEALQAYYFTYQMLFWEVVPHFGFSQGRLDQYLFPHFEEDIRNGVLTKEDAQELIDCYLIKLNHGGGSGTIAVGGLKANGHDATNDLSYMFIEGIMRTRLTLPYFAVLIHSNSPDGFLIKSAQLCALGTGHPQFLNSDVGVAQALTRGSTGGPPITLEDARAGAPIGCSEVGIPGKDAGYLHTTGATNLATYVELLLKNGRDASGDKVIGVETGDPIQFTTFGEVQEAFHKQLAWMTRNCQIIGNRNEQKIIDHFPTVYESALIDDCIEKGVCREEGGAHYNFNTGSFCTGTTDAGDSLAAIKKLVFDEKRITMAQLCEAVDSNFEGHEEIRRMCLDAPKFGNDDDEADEQIAWVHHQWVEETTKIRNLRGGYCSPGGSPMWGYVPLGEMVGALPSGRLAGKPLADGDSPSPGNDVNGPTAVLKSMGKIDNIERTGGAILNMRLDPAAVEDGDVSRLVSLLRGFLDQKAYHIQINIISTETLRAAQEDPEAYQDLMVKVAGYNAFFVRLNKPLQESIIARTLHSL